MKIPQPLLLATAALVGANLLTAQAFAVNTTADTVDANPGDGVAADASGRTSLRAAIQEANALGSAATVWIRLQPHRRYALSIGGAGEDAAASGDLDILGDIRVNGLGATVDAAGLDRAFDVLAGARLELIDCDIVNGSVVDSSGGAVRSAAELLMLRCTVTDSSATGAGASGGAVFNDGGTFDARESSFWRNDATRAGGAIEANAGTTHLFRSDFGDNSTGPMPGNGGGLHLTGAGRVTVTRCTFDGNVAAREGGALWNSGTGTMLVNRSTIVDNEALGSAADDGGGGLFNDGGMLVVRDSRIIRNRAVTGAGSGGGVLNLDGVLGLVNCELEANSSQRAGGGVEASGGTTGLLGCLVLENATGMSPGNGGGLHLTGMGDVFARLCVFDGNFAAAEGGGMWNSSAGRMHVRECSFFDNVASGNAADQGGGGLHNDGGELAIVESWFVANAADGSSGSGGAVLNDDGIVVIESSLFRDNWSLRAGGAVEANVGDTRLANCVLIANATGPAPGNGGGLHLTGAGSVDLTACLLFRNGAANEGGGLWNSSTGMMTASACFAVGNRAPIGADLFNDGGTFVFNGQPVQ